MPEFRTIEIDFDIHKLIEAERLSFSETPSEVLRRILGIGEAKPEIKNPRSGKSWSAYGVILPHGTALRMTYNGVEHSGVIDDGMWLVDGEEYSSPSGAASAVAKTKRGKATRLDGWRYWHVKKPDSADWTELTALWTKETKPKRI